MPNAVREIRFPKLGHFWFDAGLIGFYELARMEQPEESGVHLVLDDEGVTVSGTETDLSTFLKRVYSTLLQQYYNTSSEKQEQEKAGFYYDSKQDTFVRFAKVKQMGIAGLIFDKAPRPTQGEIKYVKDAGPGTLPPEYVHLQERLNTFLKETNLKISGTSLLLDGPNACQPKVTISTTDGKPKGNCFLCGRPSHALTDIGGTVFPMISGSSGALTFNSGCGGPAKVCWKCDYIGKFVPVTGFYVTDGGINHIYFPYSASLEKMHEVFGPFESIKTRDPYYLRNFNPELGGYFKKPYEQLVSFLYSVYRRILTSSTDESEEDGDPALDYDRMYDLTLSRAPLEIFVLYTEALGKTQMGKMIWPFKDSVYMFRLFEHLETHGIPLKQTMQILIDFDQKKDENKTLLRNRICERILRRQSVVDLVEQHVFRINASKVQYIKPVHDFVIEYEKILTQENDPMKQELIDTAVSLGKTIGMILGPEKKKGKGDLFRLRKARRPEDFLNEVNRIQMKYDALVTADLYQNGEGIEQHFPEFKQFCMIAALNTYNAMNRPEKKEQKTTN